MLLSVEGVSKVYPGLPVLHDVSFTVEEGEIICLLGPSGVGKSTLLHIIAGLEAADTGRVLFEGRDLAGVPVHRRNFGLMFQDFALFPHRNVFGNVAFGLRMQGRPDDEIAERVSRALALVKLSGYESRRVVELSGGEKQRVALARSLAPGPRVLMLDEPLGSLDRTLREELMNDLRAILKQVGVTALYVTHDQGEAFAVADRIFIMTARLSAGEGGRIAQSGAPSEVYRQPANRTVAQFLGFQNLLPGRVVSASGAAHVVDTPIGRLTANLAVVRPESGAEVTVLVRPEAAAYRPSVSNDPNTVGGVLVSSSFRGSYFLIVSRHDADLLITSEISAGETDLPEPGRPLALWLDPDAISLLPW